MMPQYSLFEDPEPDFRFEPEPMTDNERLRKMARQSDRQTSWQAAQQALPKLAKTKARIMTVLVNRPEGLTSSEISKILNIDKSSAGKRLGELERDGYIEICGIRPSDRNRPSNIYRSK
jgi:Fic family protein